MKFLSYFSVLLLFTTCTNRSTVIEGALPSDRYDKQVVYWVPMEGASSKTVDSTHIKKNSFRLVISAHNQNKLGIIRVRPQFRLALQEVVVFTEVGTVQVKLDSISSSSGTPFNEVIQYWKDRRMAFNRQCRSFNQRSKIADANEASEIQREFEKADSTYHSDIFQLIDKNKDNAVGKFIYSRYKSFFTEEQKEELKMNN